MRLLYLTLLILLLTGCPPIEVSNSDNSAPSSLDNAMSDQSVQISETGVQSEPTTEDVIEEIPSTEDVLETQVPTTGTSDQDKSTQPDAEEKTQKAENDSTEIIVLTEGDRSHTWIIGGPVTGNFQAGDFLNVYTEIVPGTEIAIAQLRVININPTSLLAQTTLINPKQKMRSGLRVDGNLEMLSASELVPAEEFALGYLLESNRIRLRPGSEVSSGMVLQAFEGQIIGGRISDYLPFSPPILMRVTQIGISGVIASVTLEGHQKWPQAGTLVSDLGVEPTPTPTYTSTPVLPTATPLPTLLPTVAVTLVPTKTPPPVTCQVEVDPELMTYWAQAELGCPLSFSSIAWASYTPYQTGFMLWRRDTNQVYGLFNNGNWLSVPDVWDGSSATRSRGHPPPGFKEPIRGTGYVWGTDDRFFNGLGWASDDQKGFCTKVQTFEQGFMLLSSTTNSCHEQNLFNHATQGDFPLSFLKAHNSGYWRQ